MNSIHEGAEYEECALKKVIHGHHRVSIHRKNAAPDVICRVCKEKE